MVFRKKTTKKKVAAKPVEKLPIWARSNEDLQAEIASLPAPVSTYLTGYTFFGDHGMPYCCGVAVIGNFEIARDMFEAIQTKENPPRYHSVTISQESVASAFMLRVRGVLAAQEVSQLLCTTAEVESDEQTERCLDLCGFRRVSECENPNTGNVVTIWAFGDDR